MSIQALFTAVISSEAIDREHDVVLASAMVDALQAWISTGKRIPLAWNRSSAPEDLVGHIEPASVEAVDGEVVASGWVDQDTDRGAQTWRLMKSGTLGFSFGYLVVDSVKRADGVREIRQLDVFEISATAAPMNGAARVLSTKGAGNLDDMAEREALMLHQTLVDLDRRYQAGEFDVKQAEVERSPAAGPIQIATFDC